ncbi:arylamine N-acetyltransferase [Dactylosporangium sp. NBC_01737]|uniref:arylamine N-acetyltransferase family protein n=1 Tax=Dactylosporangium sp. NBC_01737 TaxID=2975959 RepID=UPI002E1269CF|nr:arylamine N-acetyltransferase [Dactylosporangium sp. NBC_01737]
MDEARVDAYLDRIGVPRPAAADLATLRTLQRAHLATVPFENLSVHLGEKIVLQPAALVAKVVDRRRGGFCYELNGAFAALLTALGYEVTLHSCRVWTGRRFGVPLDHMAVRVQLDAPYLVDVGFGKFAHHPLRMDVTDAQPDPGGVYEVLPQGPDLAVRGDGTWEYLLDQRPYELLDFTPLCWWHRTSPESHFTRKLTCSIVTGTGRVTLSGRTLITTAGAERTERILDDAEILAVYHDAFGIALDAVPAAQVEGATA